MLTISGLCKTGHLAARSVMSSLFRSVAVTTARSTALVTKLCGGEILESIRLLRPAQCGSKVIRYPRIWVQAAESARSAEPQIICYLASPGQMTKRSQFRRHLRNDILQTARG